jgi:hypothetical protein
VGNTTRSPGSKNQTDRLFWLQWTHVHPHTTGDKATSLKTLPKAAVLSGAAVRCA